MGSKLRLADAMNRVSKCLACIERGSIGTSDGLSPPQM